MSSASNDSLISRHILTPRLFAFTLQNSISGFKSASNEKHLQSSLESRCGYAPLIYPSVKFSKSFLFLIRSNSKIKRFLDRGELAETAALESSFDLCDNNPP